jgi:phage shock protein PspC (stress-responsive transcriptional regulator)
MEPSRRLVRSDIDRIIGGVCGGIANYLGVDPLIVRIVFVVISWAFGLSWLLYAVLWAVLPGANSANQSGDMMTGTVQTPARSADITI